MTDSHRLVVVGASLAGLRAVEAARAAGFGGGITLIGAEPHLPYDRPPLSKAFLDELPAGQQPASTQFRPATVISDELDVELLLGVPATALDTVARAVTLSDGRQIRYDTLVIATGADARTLPGTGDLAGVHTLRTVDDAVAVRAALDAGARTVVIGAGFIGSEIASGARKRGLSPVVVEALPTPLVRAVGQEMGATLASLHTRNGTDLRCGVPVAAIEGESNVEHVVLADGTVIPADLVVVGAGAIPGTAWLEGSGLNLDNGVVCDENLWTGVDGVYAAGDVARWHNSTFDRLMRLEHWTSAAEQGAAAVRNALNPDLRKPYSTVPYFWSDWYDVRIQFVGVPAEDEIVVIEDLDTDGRLVALYREGDRLAGSLTIDGQTEIMKYRGQITRSASWSDAVGYAQQRKARRAEKLATTVPA
ncbi:NAD(P)/FAD-dependent oxidoreductase [Rhodococcus opacus]|uniref:Pyridine nucleotide-disulfide oxidoreductase n=1 Tax=Rhodococcus opacus TaxID=37919 RepID=A0A076EYS9_RHOOP|nr:FAD-dependent oxidoreductase [Rhodococcus opacus]AII10941.1 pyridine nucleotide-disulfide oxidoreductase [Rhodococcus opacus]